MPHFFISYRRDDSAAHAGRLADHLRERFGDDHVFIDVESIDPGVDFPTAIGNALAQTHFLIAVIGPRWVTAAHQDGRRRLDDDRDYVRLELVTGMERKIRVTPVLVHGARMPGEEDLPKPLAPLARCNAVTLRDDSFRRDADALVERLTGKPPLFRRPAAWLAGAAAVALLGAAVTWQLQRPQPPEQLDFRLKLQVRASEEFGPVDTAPEWKLAHRKPTDSLGISLLSGGTPVGARQYEYESPIIMPPKGNEWRGLLHRNVMSGVRTEPRYAEACFVRGAGSSSALRKVRLNCTEGGSCSVPSDDFGWAKPCPSAATQLRFGSLLPLAFAAAPPGRPGTGWVVPSLATLKKQEAARQNPAFTEFILKSGPIAALSKANRLTYAIRVNGTSVYIDGLPPETNVVPFQAATGVQLSFGLENLDFSGRNAGWEDIEVTLQFAADQQVLRTATVGLRYIALRPMPEGAANGAADLGLRWRADYHIGRAGSIYQIFLLSTPSGPGAVTMKQRIDAGKLALDGATVVAVVRPPLENSQYGVALGIAQPSGQVKFAFDDKESRKLCSALAAMPPNPFLIHATAFRRNIENRNFSRACSAL